MQSFALAAAAGYQHTEFYSMVDGNTCQEPPWGLERADGSRRPVADALRTAVNYFSNFTNARFAPLTRPQEAWPAWPGHASSYLPNWQIYQVAFDRPGNQRVTALWNGDGGRLRVRVPKNGTSGRVVDRRGFERPARVEDGAWVVDLPGATSRFQLDDVNKDPISSSVFRRISQRTGGKAYWAKTWQKQVEAFESIREDIGNSYTVTYYPAPNPNEGFRKIAIQIPSDTGKHYRVQSRPGYRPRAF